MNRATRLITVALALFLAGAPVGADSTEKSDSRITLEAYSRAGTLVTLPTGRRLNIRCIGTGSPTVILTAGAGEQSLTWRSLQAQIARSTRVCAWDRAGFGFSDPSPATQDAVHTTDDLEAVLRGGKTPPPYVLVGHSLGSFETLMFTFRHPHEVRGIVLIDPASPYQNRRLGKVAPDVYAVIDGFQRGQVSELKSCIDLMRHNSAPGAFEEKCLAPPVRDYPASLNRALRQRERNVDAKANFLSLLDNAISDNDSRELEASWRTLGRLPLLVLTAGKPPPIPLDAAGQTQMPRLQAEWSTMHDEIASLSTRGVNRTVPDTTHYIYKERQEIVLDAVHEIMSAP